MLILLSDGAGRGPRAGGRRAAPRSYLDSREELTPGRGDLLAPVPVAAAALATLAWPSAWRQFVGGSAGAYSLTPAAWDELTRAARARTAAA